MKQMYDNSRWLSRWTSFIYFSLDEPEAWSLDEPTLPRWQARSLGDFLSYCKVIRYLF